MRGVLTRALLAALCLMVGAWGSAHAAPPAPDGVVKALYQHYLETAPDTEVTFNFTDPAVAKDYFDPTLARLVVADARRNAPRLDFDPFVDGQDFEIKAVETQTKMVSPREARVVAKFENFEEKKTVTFKLVKVGADWRIADVQWEGDRDTLRALLSKTASR